MDIHLFKTKDWVHEVAMMVQTYRGRPPLEITAADGLHVDIANADSGVDLEAVAHGLVDTVTFRGMRYWAQKPNSDLGGAVPEQYYHYPSKADAEDRLMKAIEAKDPTAFGRALHSYQDYYAHTLSGYTAGPNDVGSLFSNCPECFERESFGVLFERALGTGHPKSSFADVYDPTEQRAIDMKNGTMWYTLLFLLSYYGIDEEQFMANTGCTLDDWGCLENGNSDEN